MNWFGDLARLDGRMRAKDEAWLRAQPDVATAWLAADTPARLCWVASLGTRSDLLLLSWLEAQTDALVVLGDRASPAHAALLGGLVADCRALLAAPGASVASDGLTGEGHRGALEAALGAVEREQQLLRAVVALRAERQVLVGARAAARSLDLATRTLGMRLTFARLAHDVALGNEKAAALAASSEIDATMVDQLHLLTFEYYAEALGDLVRAGALEELARSDARWTDAQLARASRFVIFGLKALAEGAALENDGDDLACVVGVGMEPIRHEHRRAMLDRLRADLTLPDDDDDRAAAWERVQMGLIAEARAGA